MITLDIECVRLHVLKDGNNNTLGYLYNFSVPPTPNNRQHFGPQPAGTLEFVGLSDKEFLPEDVGRIVLIGAEEARALDQQAQPGGLPPGNVPGKP